MDEVNAGFKLKIWIRNNIYRLNTLCFSIDIILKQKVMIDEKILNRNHGWNNELQLCKSEF